MMKADHCALRWPRTGIAEVVGRVCLDLAT